MKSVRNTLAIGLLATSAMLTGCGGAPSAEDVQDALKAHTKESTAAARNMGVNINLDDMIVVNDVKNCEEIRDDVYQCSVEATTKIFGMENTTIANMSFTKNSKGEWRAVQ